MILGDFLLEKAILKKKCIALGAGKIYILALKFTKSLFFISLSGGLKL